MPSWVVPVFLGGAAVSLVASSRLVIALEQLGSYFGMPEVLLGLLVALAADGPELTSAVAAELGGKRVIGVGVLFGSNVFNIATLLGLGSLLAGGVILHRRVVVLEGFAALGVAGAAVALASGGLGPGAAAGVTMGVFVPYVVLSTVAPSRLPLPSAAARWLTQALIEEGEEVSQAYPVPPARLGPSAGTAALALVVVVAASALMERAASVGGSALGVPQVIVGAIVLAAVTSLPNAVAAVYLARTGKAAAMLTEALNSNTINVVGGLVLPAALGGFALSNDGSGSIFAGASYAGMTVLAIGTAYKGRGIGVAGAAALIGAYVAFLAVLVAVS